jgi:hypothetical protein
VRAFRVAGVVAATGAGLCLADPLPHGFLVDAEVSGNMRDRAAGGADLADGPLAASGYGTAQVLLRARSMSLASGTPRNRSQLMEKPHIIAGSICSITP